MSHTINHIKTNARIFKLSGKNGYIYTSQPFLQDVYVFFEGKMVNSGKAKCYIYGPIKRGQYVSTYYLYGIGFATDTKACGFATALQDKNNYNIGVIEIEFLPRPNAESNEVTV